MCVLLSAAQMKLPFRALSPFPCVPLLLLTALLIQSPPPSKQQPKGAGKTVGGSLGEESSLHHTTLKWLRCVERGPAGWVGRAAGLQDGQQVFPVIATLPNQASHEMWRRGFPVLCKTAPFGLQLFQKHRGMSQNMRTSLFGGNCHVSPLCFIPLVRHDEGLKTQPPEFSRPPQPLTGTHD